MILGYIGKSNSELIQIFPEIFQWNVGVISSAFRLGTQLNRLTIIHLVRAEPKAELKAEPIFSGPFREDRVAVEVIV